MSGMQNINLSQGVPTPGTAPNLDFTDQEETMLQITTCSRRASTQTAAEKERLSWAREVFDRVKFSSQPKRNVKVETNFIRLSLSQTSSFYKYRITLGDINEKPVKKREVKQALVFKLLTVQRPPSVPYISDYCSFVISKDPLYPEFRDTSTGAWRVLHRRSPKPCEAPPTMKTIFTDEGVCNFRQMIEYYKAIFENSRNNIGQYHPDVDIRALNIISWKNINDSRLFDGGIHGKKFYPANFPAPKVLKSGDVPLFVLSRGFFTSIRPGEKAFYLNINPTTTAFFSNNNLQRWIQTRKKGGITNGIPNQDIQDELRGLRVMFNGDQPGHSGKVKQRIILGFPGSVNNTFFTKVGESQKRRVHQYMRTQYPQLTFNQDACCINVGTVPKPKYYPADQLMLAPWQPVRGKIDKDYTKEILNDSQKTPYTNKDDIMKKAFGPLGLLRIGKWTDDFLPKFGITFPVQPIQLENIDARFLTQPTLIFGNNKIQKLRDKPNGNKASWNLANVNFFRSDPTSNLRLGIIKLGLASGDETPIKKFSEAFVKAVKSYGYSKCVIVNQSAALDSNRQGQIRKLQTAYDGLGQGGAVSLVIVVIAAKSIPLYSTIKWWGDCQAGIPTICLTGKVLNLKDRSKTNVDPNMIANLWQVMWLRSFAFTHSNLDISLKLNSKLGGISHLLQNCPRAGVLANTMVVGADVSHPSEKERPSMAGVVATRDSDMVHYLASARLQACRQEHIEELDKMIEERLEDYYALNEKLPDHILFYRDGVSESQFGMVKNKEIPKIRVGCVKVGKAKKITAKDGREWCPKITLLVVGKRHHTRFYPDGYPDTNQHWVSANLHSGLVVDSQITQPSGCDFYLQSHDCQLGTARSAHYMVILNEIDYKMDQLEEVTDQLCFLGSRATKALSVCTPARYADTLCDRLRCYMRTSIEGPMPAHGASVDAFRRDTNTWGRNLTVNPDKPWHKTLNNIMFYL